MDFMELYVHERGDVAIVKSGWRVVLCLKDLLPLNSGCFWWSRCCVVVLVTPRGVGPGTQAPTGGRKLLVTSTCLESEIIHTNKCLYYFIVISLRYSERKKAGLIS
jgi:hypothetical protein